MGLQPFVRQRLFSSTASSPQRCKADLREYSVHGAGQIEGASYGSMQNIHVLNRHRNLAPCDPDSQDVWTLIAPLKFNTIVMRTVQCRASNMRRLQCTHEGIDSCGALQMDVWALGVCIYCWMFGRLPFVGQTILETFEAIKQNELQFDTDVDCSEELRDLLVKVTSDITFKASST